MISYTASLESNNLISVHSVTSTVFLLTLVSNISVFA